MEASEEMHDLAVIGFGGAGQMAALRGVLNHLKTVVFAGDPETMRKSRATWVSEVDNIPGFFGKKNPITSTGRETLKFISEKEDLQPFCKVIKKAAVAIAKKEDHFVVSSSDETVKARFVVLCSGTMDVQPHIGGSIEPILPFANRGDVLYCIRCDGHQTVGHSCAVIGHTGVAGWIAVMLRERYQINPLYVLTHGEEFQGSDEVKGLLTQYDIKIINGEVEGVLGDPKQGLEGFKVGGETVAVTKSFVALGSIVYNDLAKQLNVQTNEREHLVADENGETNVAGFFAAGDLVEGKKKQVYTAWDLAVDVVDTIDERIRILKRSNQY